MKLRLTLVVLAIASLVSSVALAAPPAAANNDDAFTGMIGIKVGQKMLHKSDWKFPGLDLSSQMGYGLQITAGQKKWPVLAALDVDMTSAKKSGVTGSTMEISLGARKPFALQGMPIMPYVGAGVSYGQAKFSGGGISQTGTGEGLWIDGGAQYVINKMIGVGLDLRYDSCPGSKKISGTTVHVEAGGFEPAITVGYMF